MRIRLIAVLSGLLLAASALPATAAKTAPTPRPGIDEDWPMCGSPSQIYCLTLKKRNGADVPDLPSPGSNYQPYIDFIGKGTIRYGVDYYADPSGGSSTTEVDPDDVYRIIARTGPIHPRELDGTIRDVDFSIGSNATGWTFDLTFKPTPIHWVGYGGDTRTCQVYGGCGGDKWRASLNRDGFVTGYVTDLSEAGIDRDEISWRTGMVRAYNAQDEDAFYDPDTNALEVRLANPHLTGSGALSTGSYEAFLPNAYLVNFMNIPDPSSLTGGSMIVTREEGTEVTRVPITLEHYPRGIKVTIAHVTYSKPTYRIKARPKPPGKPRHVIAKKVKPHKARVQFRKPLANGGRAIDRYQARCHRKNKPWHSARGKHTPIYVPKLPKGKVWCQVRAHNAKGFGKWSAADRT